MLLHLRPKHVWWATAIYTLGFVAWHLMSRPSAALTWHIFRASSFGSLCWYLIAAVLAWRILRTHARGSLMRRAWMLMAGSAVAAPTRPWWRPIPGA